MGSSNETSYFGNVHNPWKKGYVPGGSSGVLLLQLQQGIVPAATGQIQWLNSSACCTLWNHRH